MCVLCSVGCSACGAGVWETSFGASPPPRLAFSGGGGGGAESEGFGAGVPVGGSEPELALGTQLA